MRTPVSFWLSGSTQLVLALAVATHLPAQQPPASGLAAPATHFLIVGKGKIADPFQQQQRGIDAVHRVAEAAKSIQPEAKVEALAEKVMTVAEYRGGLVKESVDGAIFRAQLDRLVQTATPRDTVIIYTHSHGLRNGFESAQPLGGLVMDLPVLRPEHGGALLWDEYAELLLKIPARNVVVLTMSCFSGGLVEYLDSPAVSPRWKMRWQEEGRNLVVLTSQNKELTSAPIAIGGEIINPFTYAVSSALRGEADGFAVTEMPSIAKQPKDYQVSIGEFVDFILHTTENLTSEHPGHRNTAKPQLTGSFRRDEILYGKGRLPENGSPGSR
jgi:hypothetical protein